MRHRLYGGVRGRCCNAPLYSINQDNVYKSYENNVVKVKKAESKYTGDLNTSIEEKDAALQPIVPKEGGDNNQQSETNHSSSQNNETPTDTENKGNSNTVGQSSVNANTNSSESKGEGSNDGKNADKSTVFKSNYQGQAPNEFVANIHKTVGQGRLEEENIVNKQQNFTNNQLDQKKNLVSKKQNELDVKSKDTINKGVKKNIGGSIFQDVMDNVNDNITATKNIYFDVTGQPERKEELSKIDKPTINISGDELKIQKSTNIKIQKENPNISDLDSAEKGDKTKPNLLKQSSNNASSKPAVQKQNTNPNVGGKNNTKSEDK